MNPSGVFIPDAAFLKDVHRAGRASPLSWEPAVQAHLDHRFYDFLWSAPNVQSILDMNFYLKPIAPDRMSGDGEQLSRSEVKTRTRKNLPKCKLDNVVGDVGTKFLHATPADFAFVAMSHSAET